MLIPAAAAIQLAQVSSVRLHTHVEGRLLDGSSVSTNEYLPSAIPTSSDQDTSSCVSSSGGGTVASCTPAPNVVPYVGIWREVVFAENDVPGVTCQNIAAIGTACPPDAPPLNCVDDEEVLKLSIGLCQSEQFVGDWYGCLLPQTENFVAYRSDSVCSLNEELSCSFVTATNISCTLSGSSGTSMPPTGLHRGGELDQRKSHCDRAGELTPRRSTNRASNRRLAIFFAPLLCLAFASGCRHMVLDIESDRPIAATMNADESERDFRVCSTKPLLAWARAEPLSALSLDFGQEGAVDCTSAIRDNQLSDGEVQLNIPWPGCYIIVVGRSGYAGKLDFTLGVREQ